MKYIQFFALYLQIMSTFTLLSVSFLLKNKITNFGIFTSDRPLLRILNGFISPLSFPVCYFLYKRRQNKLKSQIHKIFSTNEFTQKEFYRNIFNLSDLYDFQDPSTRALIKNVLSKISLDWVEAYFEVDSILESSFYFLSHSQSETEIIIKYLLRKFPDDISEAIIEEFLQ